MFRTRMTNAILDRAEAVVAGLMPIMTGCYQRRLVQAILADSQIPGKEPDCRKFPESGPDKIKTTVEALGDLQKFPKKF